VTEKLNDEELRVWAEYAGHAYVALMSRPYVGQSAQQLQKISFTYADAFIDAYRARRKEVPEGGPYR
jgi:hypothetical protein